MAVTWRKEMSVDGGPIDDDHRALIAIINEFCTAEAGASQAQRLQAILGELDTYTRAHFEREERLQIAAQYPYHEAHHREHLDLIKRLVGLHTRLDAACADEETLPRVHAEVGSLLHDWLVEHIIKSDLRMAPYAIAMSKHVVSLTSTPEMSATR